MGPMVFTRGLSRAFREDTLERCYHDYFLWIVFEDIDHRDSWEYWMNQISFDL